MNTETREIPSSIRVPSMIDAQAGHRPARERIVMPKEFLSFRLGHEEYGIDILRVQEIRSYEQPTRIANAPFFVKGVVNLRGAIVPVIDLRLKLGLEGVEYSPFTVIIVLSVRRKVIGAVVDSVSDVLALEADSIKPPPEMNSIENAGFIMGIGCIEQAEQDRMLILADIEALIGSSGLDTLDSSFH